MKRKFMKSTLFLAMAGAVCTANASNEGLSNYKINSSNNAKYSNSYNLTSNSDKLPVTAYLSNWAHYEQGYEPNIDELAKYDTVLLSFFGMCGTEVGDPTITSGVDGIKTSCAEYGLEKFELAPTDPYADFGKAFSSVGQSWQEGLTWKSPNPNGLLGVMKKLHEEKGTRVGVSVFGWSLSNAVSDAVKPENRDVLVNSLISFVTAYPFIGQLDIDWEYPGIKGAEQNIFDPVNDARNYKEFIAQLRKSLDDIGREDVAIAIASGAPTDKLEAAGLKGLVESGVDSIHLMTYDFFGQWDVELNHHTNLYSSDTDKWSADKAIQYMIKDLDVPSTAIEIGYAAYSRNAIVKGDLEPSPLKGEFSPQSNTLGTFEAAVTTANDLFANYVSISEGKPLTGKNGYQLFTDKESNADFFYNENNDMFVSIDTPRTVYAKSQYAKENKLGGTFVWMADHDEGLLLNAAREGLGYEVVSQRFDMSDLISSCGVNIETQAECDALNDSIPTEVDIVKVSGIYGPTPKSNQEVIASITTPDGSVTKVKTYYSKDQDNYTWPDDVARNINRSGISNVNAGEMKNDGSIEVVGGSSYRNKVWGIEGTTVKFDLLDGQLHKLADIEGPTPNGNDIVVTNITTPDGEAYQLETVFINPAESYGWPGSVAKGINAMQIPGVKAGELRSDASVSVVNGSSYRNDVYGPEGTEVSFSLKPFELTKLSTISLDSTPVVGQIVTTTITETTGKEHIIETIYRTNPSSYGYQDDIALDINNANLPNIYAGEVTTQTGSKPQVIAGSSYRNKIWGPEGSTVTYKVSGGILVNSWDPSETYNSGDVVSYSGREWKAHWWVQGGDNPEVSYQKDQYGVWRPAK
ncbi:glycosyl hydrolase family 18 protein [Vibrio sp. 10N.261.46.A3]|uniref:glycosyl hydrolase family 18 protein n=1 Tax=Vibrio sp. 10N.261.46.A3 TaxID=3229658 RepID=UPI00354EAA3F